MGHLSLCWLKSTPCFKPTYVTQINDPWTSVDMVLPVPYIIPLIMTFGKKRLNSHRISRGIFGNIFLDPFNVEQ